MNKKSLIMAVIFVGMATAMPALTQAQNPSKITLKGEFKGTVIITAPNGELTLLEAGDPMPEIANGSTLEVFDGSFTVETEGDGQVSVGCLGQEGSLSDGASANLTCEEKSGLLKVLKGSVELIDANGKKFTLTQGTDFAIQEEKNKEDEEPATAEGNPIGGDPLGGDLASEPAVDSRNIESSPQ